MIFDDLREFVDFLEDKKELLRIKTEVDPLLEITEITDRISKKEGPALFFEKVKDSDIPLAINLFGSYKRMSWGLGLEDFKFISDRFSSLFKVLPDFKLRKKFDILKEL
ncbi:MAG: menaquinone biosynthesis decarboxylase, partial [Nitrospirota bacterium]